MSYGDLLGAIQSFDLEEYLMGLGFDQLKGDEWLGDCPGCGKRKLAVHTHKRTFHCWVCQEYETTLLNGSVQKRPVQGAGGLIKLLEWLEGLDTKEAIQHILDANGHPEDLSLTAHLDPAYLYALDYQQPVFVLPPEGAAPITYQLPYLQKRGVTMWDVQQYGLFQCLGGKYNNRLVFPVWEEGRLVYWQARAMYEADEAPHGKFIKALNPPAAVGVASNEVLFNLEQAVQYPRICIVEGPMDVIRTGPDAVCTFGKQLYPRQIEKLVRRGVQAVDLMWDGPTDKEPEGAHPEMLALAPTLHQHFADVRLVFLPHGDPGDWDRASLGQLRASGLPLHLLQEKTL